MKRLLKILVSIIAALCAVAPYAGAEDYRHRMPLPDRLWVHHDLRPDCVMHPAGAPMPCATPWTGEAWIGEDPDKFTVSHEVGHVFWELDADEADRIWFRRRLGFRDERAWYGSVEDYQRMRWPPTELAADAYAACDLGLRPPAGSATAIMVRAFSWETGYDYVPSARKHRRICRRIVEIGGRR